MKQCRYHLPPPVRIKKRKPLMYDVAKIPCGISLGEVSSYLKMANAYGIGPFNSQAEMQMVTTGRSLLQAAQMATDEQPDTQFTP